MLRSGVATNSSGERNYDLFWELWGADGGVPLLLINGLGSPMVSYEQGFLEQFVAAGFQVVRFDNRDAGRSTKSDPKAGQPPYLVSDMAVDAVAVMDAVGWDQANIWGVSMGGMIAQQLAIDHSTRVLGLISVMSMTGEPGHGGPSKAAQVALVQTQPTEREAWLDLRVEAEKIWASPEFYSTAVSREKASLLYDYGVSPVGTAQQYRAIMASGSRDEALSGLALPSLVIHGSVDQLISPEGGRHTAEVIPGARYVEIDGFGHDLPEDLWPRLVREVAEFAL